jgi:hypothetical protein
MPDEISRSHWDFIKHSRHGNHDKEDAKQAQAGWRSPLAMGKIFM